MTSLTSFEKTELHPLYPFGAIKTLEQLNQTLKHQGKEKPVLYVEAQDVIINSYSETNSGKPPKYLVSQIATQYLEQFAIQETVQETEEIKAKNILNEYVEALKENHPKLKKLTTEGYNVQIRVIDSRIDFLVMKDNRPVYGRRVQI